MRAAFLLIFTSLLFLPAYADSTDPSAAASAALASGDNATAIKIASSAIGGNSVSKLDAAKLYAVRGRAYLATQAYDNAQSDLSASIAAFASNADACASLGDVFASRSEAYAKLRRYRDALDDANVALTCEIASAVVQFDIGTAYFGLIDNQSAVAAYSAAIALKPDYKDAFSQRGKSYENLNRIDDAIADYDKVLALDPSDWGTYNNRATAYTFQRKYDDAIADLNRSITLHPTLFLSFANRAEDYALKGDYASAQADLDQARKLDADPILHAEFERLSGPGFTKRSEAQMDYIADYLANRPKH